LEHHRLAWATRALGSYLKFSVVAWRLFRDVDSAALKHKYRRQLVRIVRARGFEPHILLVYAIKIAMHYHYAAIASALAKVDAESGVMPDAAPSFSRVRRPVPAEAAAS
jgi:soluble lytic murein transglycosylase-like protein